MKKSNARGLAVLAFFWLLGSWAVREAVAAGGSSSTHGPELVLQSGHAQRVQSLAVSPDGKYLLSGSNDFSAVLWEIATGRQLRRFTGHLAGVVAVAFSPNVDRVLTAAGSPDNSAIVWEMATGRKIATIRDPNSSWIKAAAFSPNGLHVLTTPVEHYSATVIWDANTAARVRTLDGGSAQAVSSNESAVFSADGRYVLTGGSRFQARPSKGYVMLWDAATGELVRTFEGHQYGVTYVAISPTGTHAVSASQEYDKGKDLFELFLWDVSTGEKLRRLEGHTDWIYSLTFSPDGQRLLSTAADATAIVWDVQTGKKLHVLKSGDFTVYCGTFSPDGAQAYTAGSDHFIAVWDLASGKQTGSLELATGRMTSAAFSRDCKQVAFEHYPGGIFLWETETGRPPRRIGGGASGDAMAFTPDGRYLLGGSTYTPSLWDLANGREIYEFKAHHTKCGITAMAFSADGQQFLSGGHGLSDTPGSTDESKWFNELLLSDTATGGKLRAFDCPKDHLQFAALSPDGKRALSGQDHGQIVLWDATTGQRLRVLQERGDSPFVAAPVAFSPDGRQALGGSWDETAILWDAASGEISRRFQGHSGRVTALAFSADGGRILTASEDGTAVLWDAASGQKLQTFHGNGGHILQVAIHPNGRQALTYSKDWNVRVWDLESGLELARLMQVGAKGDWLVATPEGLFDGTDAARRQILFRVGGRLDVVPVDRFFQDFYRPGLLAEIWKAQRPLPKVELGKAAAPLVRIVSPDRGGKTPKVRIALKVDVIDRGGGIRGPWVVHNGARVIAPGPSQREGRTLHRTLEIPLITGENRLEVRAASEDGSWESEPASITLSYEEPQVQPELYVLAIGINRYAQETLNLKYAVPDAQAIADVFRSRAASIYGEGKIHVTTLLDGQATRKGIQAALDEAAKTVKSQDTMIAFLAGHGTTVGQRYYFIPHEFANRAERLDDDIKNQGLAGDVLSDGLGAVAALKRILIFDTCQSGGNITVQRTSRNPFAFRGALERLSRDQGIFTIAATAATADAQEVPQLGHGVLSYALLAALGAVEGGPLEQQPLKSLDGNVVGVREWFSYAQDKVPQLTKVYFGQEQLVGFSGQGNNFPVLPVKHQ